MNKYTVQLRGLCNLLKLLLLWRTKKKNGILCFLFSSLLYFFSLPSKGLVRSPATVTFSQIGSRLYITWEILWNFPEIQSNILVTSLVLSWSLTEIVRHSFFAVKETFGSTPFWLLWLRYSTFFLLHPTGIFSEMVLMYNAFPFMKESYKWMRDEIRLYVLIIILALFFPGSLFVHFHLHGQRKKALSKSKGD